MNGQSKVGPADPAGLADSLFLQIDQITDSIRACERLCLLSARTVSRCVIRINQDPTDGPLTFIPGVSTGQHNREISAGGRSHGRAAPEAAQSPPLHVTTSAQCIAALQHLLPVVGRFQLGVQESKGLPFQQIERRTLRELEPRVLRPQIRDIIKRGLMGLQAPDVPISPTFGYLDPFTAAQVLRAVAPSRDIYRLVWWNSLFTVLWFINRHSETMGEHPNTRSTGAASTAFLTSKCVDALEAVLDVFRRRRDRFRNLLEHLIELRAVEAKRKNLQRLTEQKLINQGIFDLGYSYRAKTLSSTIKDLVNELQLDNSLQNTYDGWVSSIPESENDFGDELCRNLAKAVGQESAQKEAGELRREASNNLKNAAEMCARIERIGSAVRGSKAGDLIWAQERARLPDWVCSEDYWRSTEQAIAGAECRPEVISDLQRHWKRHLEASNAALAVLAAFSTYLTNVLDAFKGFPANAEPEPARQLIKQFQQTTTTGLDTLEERLKQIISIGSRWCEVLMDRHVAHAASGALTQFDAGELAHALRVVCRMGPYPGFDVTRQALNTICAAQQPNGTWGCQQPFRWDGIGRLSPTLSVETAWSMVSTIGTLLSNPNQFAASREEVSAGLLPVFVAVERFFRWLSSTLQTLPEPPALMNRADGPPLSLHGWCSDRTNELGRIHSWVTANAIEFLVEFRSIQQERINALLRSEFTSHPPSELKPLSDLEPTDLAGLGETPKRPPVTGQLLELLRPHRLLELAGGPWLPSEPRVPQISFWSGIFYGPPGSSKTTLAQSIAAELDWPLISLSPADFLARGDQGIEARAQEIFAALTAGSRLVYFFDEIDELIRDRHGETSQRSVFSFLTPSFLTKLQGFRDAAKRNEFIFVIGTNYFERIDAAAKRSGRIDESFLVVYPDLPARGHIMLEYLLSQLPTDSDAIFAPLEAYLRRLGKAAEEAKLLREGNESESAFFDVFVEFCGLLSYSSLRGLRERLKDLTIRGDDLKISPDDLKTLVEEMKAVRHGRSRRFRPEISLADYVGRGLEAVEEAARVARLIPALNIRWLAPDHDEAEPLLDLAAQWKTLAQTSRKAGQTDFEKELYEEMPEETRKVIDGVRGHPNDEDQPR